MPLALGDPWKTHIAYTALGPDFLEMIGDCHGHSDSGRKYTEFGCLDLLGHEEATVHGVRKVPYQERTEDVRRKATIWDSRLGSMKCQGSGEEKEEVMDLLANLVSDLFSEYSHGDTDEKAAGDDQDACDP